MKSKNKISTVMISVISLLMLFLVFGIPQQQFPTAGSYSTTFTETQSNTNSKTFHTDMTYNNPISSSNACGGDSKESLDYAIEILSYDLDPDENNGELKNFFGGYDYLNNNQFEISNININGLQAQSSSGGCSQQYTITNKQYSGYCKYHDSTYAFKCYVSMKGQAVDANGNPISAIYYNINDVSFDFTAYNDGTHTQQLSYQDDTTIDDTPSQLETTEGEDDLVTTTTSNSQNSNTSNNQTEEESKLSTYIFWIFGMLLISVTVILIIVGVTKRK